MKTIQRRWWVGAAVSAVLLLAAAGLVGAGAYTSSPGLAIPNNNPAGVSDILHVPDAGVVTGVAVHLDISHTWVGDLIIDLTSPSGTTIRLIDRIGVPPDVFGCNQDNLQVWLRDGEAISIENSCGSQAGGGAFRPMTALATLIGEPAHGPWTLTVIDNAAGDSGVLNAWTLDIASPPGQIADGRLNAYDLAAPVAIYPDGSGGISVYSIDPASGQGVFSVALRADELQAPGTGVPPAGHIELFAGAHAFFAQPLYVHRLNTGEMQVTTCDLEGHLYTYIWTP